MGNVIDRVDPARLTPPAPLADHHDLTDFQCGQPAMDDWLVRRARRAEARSARTYVVTNGEKVVGYYSFANGAVMRSALPPNLQRSLPELVPITLLARLAIDTNWQGIGIGGGLLQDGLKRALHASRIVGSYGVLVHAIDDQAIDFYRRYGFATFPGTNRSLFVPMQSIAAAL